MARPKTERGARMKRSISAFPEEYAQIERFIHIVREFPDLSSEYLAQLEAAVKERKVKAYADSL